MRLGDSEEDYYRLGPSFAAAAPTDLLSMLARSRGADAAPDAAAAVPAAEGSEPRADAGGT